MVGYSKEHMGTFNVALDRGKGLKRSLVSDSLHQCVLVEVLKWLECRDYRIASIAEPMMKDI